MENFVANFSELAFQQHRWIRGGDLQTLFADRVGDVPSLGETSAHRICVETYADGSQDWAALHENASSTLSPVANVLLVHGIAGCHAAGYMIRTADTLARHGFRTFRMDARGFGIVHADSRGVPHAGRGEDLLKMIQWIAQHRPGPIHVVGFSLGGNQLLHLAGRIGAKDLKSEAAWERVERLVAVAPPIDLELCSRNLNRKRNLFYNHYFIRQLFRRAPAQVTRSKIFRDAKNGPTPRTLREFDDRVTAPLSGYRDADHYYQDASARPWLSSIDRPIRLIVSRDDPIVPFRCFERAEIAQCGLASLVWSRRGGHVGWIGPGRNRDWLSQQIVAAMTDAENKSLTYAENNALANAAGSNCSMSSIDSPTPINLTGI